MLTGVRSDQKFRVPREHGSALLLPPLAEVPLLVARNRDLLEARTYDCQGRTLSQLAADARPELLRQAWRYTAAYRDAPQPSATAMAAPLLLSGHQPQLFHAGVWFKNFALSHLAATTGATGVNLLIDNDSVHSPSLRVPTGTVADPRAETLLIDQPGADLPYEERAIRDESLFHSFADRATATMAPMIADPLVRQLWPWARQAARATGNLGRSLAQARHQLESLWGLETYELPLSHVCRLSAFRWFAAHLLSALPRLHRVYNESLADYRRANRIRSRAHPVPDLHTDGAWLEAPFWLWTAADPRRQRLMVRRTGRQLELSAGPAASWRLEIPEDRSAELATEQLALWEHEGRKLRPRALITTMFARLVLGDFFLHGVGGAKYDQLTDMIIARFFATPPPSFMVLTATARLPLPQINVTADDVIRVNQYLRELDFHPELYLDGDADAAPLIEAKRRWRECELPRGQRWQRHQQLTALNRALQPYVQRQRAQLLEQRQELLTAQRHARLLGSREYSFCLFPEATLRPLLLELLSREA